MKDQYFPPEIREFLEQKRWQHFCCAWIYIGIAACLEVPEARLHLFSVSGHEVRDLVKQTIERMFEAASASPPETSS